MTVGIRGFSSVLTQNGSRWLQNAARLSPYFSPSRGIERFTPNIAELGLASTLALAYLYQKGRAMRDHDTSNDNRWLYALGEGVTSQALLQNVKFGLPGLGMGWTAYEMGMVKGRLEKLKTALKGAVLFPLGYAGVLMGLGVTDGLRHRDATRVLQLVHQLEAEAVTAKPGTLLGQAAQQLSPVLQQLKGKITHLISLYSVKSPHLEQVPAATEAFMKAQEAFLQKCNKLPVSQMKALGRTGQILLNRLQTSPFYSLVRLLNPAFGYLLAVTFIGLPLVKLISDFALPKSQHQDVRTVGHNVAPLWFDRAIGMALPFGTDGSGGHENIYLSGNGPALIKSLSGKGGGH